MTSLFIQLRSRPRPWLAALAMAAVAALAGCGKRAAPPAEGAKVARLRAPGRWLRNLQTDFADYANPSAGPERYRLQRLADFDLLASQLRQETVLTLASAYPTADLPFYADGPGRHAQSVDMLQEVHVLVADAASVREFARNGWLAAFDEDILDSLNKAGVAPIRALGPGDPEASPPVYGIPLTRGADFAFYRKSSPSCGISDANGTRKDGVISASALLDSTGGVATDGQEFWRFFVALVWSVEPNWPAGAKGSFAADTPAARRVLEGLRRSTPLGPLPLAPNRMKFFSYLQACIDSFLGPAAEPSAATPPSACWLLSTWAQRILIAPWGPSLKLQDIGFLPLTASADAPGCSLETGYALVMTRRLAAGDPAALAAREVAGKLAQYLLSEPGQRALTLDQFQVPARRGILSAMTAQEMAVAFGARRLGLDDRTYHQKLKAGELTLDAESLQFGERSLALLREMEATLDDPGRLRRVGSNPLSMHQCFLIDLMLHNLLARPNPSLPDAPPSPQNTAEVARALQQLQDQLEADQRFFSMAPLVHNLKRASSP